MNCSSNNVKKNVTIRWVNHCIHVFVEHHYSHNSFSLEKSFVPSFLCIWSQMPWKKKKKKIYKQVLSWDFFCIYSFDDLINYQNLRSRGSVFLKAILIFPKSFLDFRLDMIEKQSIINLSSYGSKSYASVVGGT